MVGITPQVFSRDGVSQRLREIDLYFSRNNRVLEPWVALDDQDWLFFCGEGVAPYLILLDGKEGFTDAAAVVLRQCLREAAEEEWNQQTIDRMGRMAVDEEYRKSVAKFICPNGDFD